MATKCNYANKKFNEIQKNNEILKYFFVTFKSKNKQKTQKTYNDMSRIKTY